MQTIAPISATCQATVIKGVVSGLRIDPSTGIRRIQANVPISAGHSGGPLLDEFGYVVGITASDVVHERAQNLNSFIPIQDALKALRIELQSIKTSMRK